MKLANEIRNQINCGDRWYLPSVGATHFAVISEKDGFLGGLEFWIDKSIFASWTYSGR